MKRKKAIVGIIMLAAVTALGGLAIADAVTRSQPAAQSANNFPVNTAPPVYGDEFVRPPEDVIKNITNPADDPAFKFQQQTNRWPIIDQSGTQVGYIDSVDLYSRKADEPLNVKDAQGNTVGTMDRQGYHPLGTK